MIAATQLKPQANQARFERLEAYLSEIIVDLARKAPTRKPLTPGEMRQVEKLHDRFDALLRSFQDSGNPPPMLPRLKLDSGTKLTPWTRWLDGLAFCEAGRSEQLNWAAVGLLLAVYEEMFGRKVVARSTELGDNHSVSFLRAALAAVKDRVPPDQIGLAPWYYQAPSGSSLNAQIDRLRMHELRFGRERLRRFLEHPDQ